MSGNLKPRFPDLYALRREPATEPLLYAIAQKSGEGKNQEDSAAHFCDECFAIADGVGGKMHSQVASSFACETAVWAYKHIRQRRYYWLDKRLLLKRIFRTTNMAVWQKQKEAPYEDGLLTTLCVLIVSAKTIWLGNAGDAQVWIVRDGRITKLTNDKDAFARAPQNILGKKRLGLVPHYVSRPFSRGDVLCLATDGVSDYLTVSDIQTAVAATGTNTETMQNAADALIRAATVNGSIDDKTVIVVKRNK